MLVCWYAVYTSVCTSGETAVNQGVRGCYWSAQEVYVLVFAGFPKR